MNHRRSWTGVVLVLLAVFVVAGCATHGHDMNGMDEDMSEAEMDMEMDMQPMYVHTSLSGDNVVPPVTSPARGEAIGVLRGHLLVLGGTFESLETPVATQIKGGAHIHRAPAGENGGIVFELKADGGRSGSFSGAYRLSEDQLQALKQGLLYIQIHSEGNKPGVVRGQLQLAEGSGKM